MTRVCLLTTSFPRFEGDEASIFVQRLVEGYSESGASGIVLVPLDRDEPDEARCGSFIVRRFRYGIFRKGALAFGAGIMPNIRRNPLLLLQAPALLAQFCLQAFRHRRAYDVVHANWALALLAAWVIGIVLRKPYIVTVRGEDLRILMSRPLGLIFLPALRGARAVVSVNETFVEQLRSLGLGRTPCIAIPNGVTSFPTEKESSRSFLEGRPFWPRKYLLFVGSIVPRKAVENLLPLLLLPQYREHALVLCGRIEDAQYIEAVRNRSLALGVDSRVFFEGAVPPSRIGDYLASAEMYVSASTFEGRPNAVLEAMAAGIPCLVSDIPAHREIVSHGESGLLCRFDEPGSLEPVISRTTLQAFVRMAALAKERLNASTWASCASKYISLFS